MNTRRVDHVVGPFLAVCALALPSSALAAPQPGAAVLERMSAAYTALNSYSQTTRGTTTITAEGKTKRLTTRSRFAFARPNLYYMSVSVGDSGLMKLASDGAHHTTYFSRSNSYVRTPAPPSLAAFLQALSQGGVQTEFTPAFFLAGGQVRGSLEHFKLRGTASVDGAPCDHVEADLIRTQKSDRAEGHLEFYVDRQTHLLRRLSMRLKHISQIQMQKVIRQGKNVLEPRMVDMDSVGTQTISQIRVNPPLTPRNFAINLPADARQR